MGFWATSWAVDVETGKPTAKCVLLVLASYADEDGLCWPSQKRIARQAEMSVDSVQRRLRELELEDLVERKRRYDYRGYRTSDLYILKMHATPNGNVSAELGRTENAPKPQVCGLHKDESSEESSIKQHRLENGIGAKAFRGKRRAIHCIDNAQSKWGGIEQEIAERLGHDGWEILMELPKSEVEHLVVRQSRGKLDEETIDRLRLRFPP